MLIVQVSGMVEVSSIRIHSYSLGTVFDMYIVAIGWMYVVLMMSVSEATPVAGVMTFILYGVVPVSILLYLSGGGKRKRRRIADQERRAAAARADRAQNDENNRQGQEPPGHDY
jgi:hypothetical protein